MLKEKIHLLFFSEKVSILQNRVYSDIQTAKDAPYGSLNIVFNTETKIAYNKEFNESKVYYDWEYDNSVPSALFMRYYDDIADLLIKHYDLKSGIVIDIGCGKGTFLSRLASRYDFIKGLGIDPSYDGDKTICEGRIKFIKDYFSPDYVEKKPALVICRHILEHIAHPKDFLKSISASLPSEKNIPLFIEVPDLSWIIKNNAYWDFCYEHVNYFTQEGLCNCAAGTGVEIFNISSAFGNQYLWAEALINPEKGNKINFSGSTSKQNIIFKKIDTHLEVIKERLAEIRETKQIIIWGMSTKGVMYSLYLCNHNIHIDYCVDINPNKQNKYCPLTGFKILSPQDIDIEKDYAVICMNPNYIKEIKIQCLQVGISALFYNPEINEL